MTNTFSYFKLIVIPLKIPALIKKLLCEGFLFLNISNTIYDKMTILVGSRFKSSVSEAIFFEHE